MSAAWAVAAVVLSAVGYGSYFVPVRKYDVYDGLVYQWFFCCGIVIGALVVAVARNTANGWWFDGMSSKAFYVAPQGLLSGFLWSVANIWATRAIQLFGMGNYAIWHELTNLGGTFFIGVVGPQLGIPATPPRHVWLAALGFLLVFLGMIPVVLMRNEDAPRPAEATPQTGPRQGLDALFAELQDGSDSNPSRRSLGLPEEVRTANSLTWDGTLGRPDLSQLQRLRFPSHLLGSLGHSCVLPMAAPEIEEGTNQASRGGSSWLKGWLLSLVVGCIFSLQYEPMPAWRSSLEQQGYTPSGEDYVFSTCLGIFLSSTAYLVIAGGWKRINQQPLQKPVLRPALFAGFVWTLSAFFQLYAMVQLPYAVAYCLVVGGGIGVSLLWASLWFGEAAGRHNKLCLAAAFVFIAFGICLLGAAT